MFGLAYLYGHGLGYPWFRFRHPYVRYPWGYAHAYRLGFGYTWFPVYEPPIGRLAGTLVIGVFDATTGDLIWRGCAEGALAHLPMTGAGQEELDQVVGLVLAGFPPPAPAGHDPPRS